MFGWAVKKPFSKCVPLQEKQTLSKQIKWCRNPLHKMIGKASTLTLYVSQVFMYSDGWRPTPDIFIIFHHVRCRLHWSDDSYKTANKNMDILATGGLSLALGKVNLVYHQSILHLRSVMFGKVFEADQTEEAFFRRMEVSHLRSTLSGYSTFSSWFRSEVSNLSHFKTLSQLGNSGSWRPQNLKLPRLDNPV